MTYRAKDRDQYVIRCPQCGAKGRVDWIHLPDQHDTDQWMPGRATCPTEGCPQNL